MANVDLKLINKQVLAAFARRTVPNATCQKTLETVKTRVLLPLAGLPSYNPVALLQRKFLLNQIEVAMKYLPAENPNRIERQVAAVEVPAPAAGLRDQVRAAGALLFTRNIDLKEFGDLAEKNAIRPNGRGVKYFRYGLGHEYGETGAVLVVVMKEDFWESEKGQSRLRNMFLRAKDGAPATDIGIRTLQGRYFQDGYIGLDEHPEELMRHLAQKADYNRCLIKGNTNLPLGLGIARPAGLTIWMSEKEKYMGYFPQLEVRHDLALDRVKTILVPEHMWDEVAAAAQKNPQLAALLQKVPGTGATQEAFLEGREKLGRRTRLHQGSFEPNFGYDSFFLFEQTYFQTVLGRQAPAADLEAYRPRAAELINRHGYRACVAPGPSPFWLYAIPGAQADLPRESEDWKIFVNPQEPSFFPVLNSVLAVLKAHQDLGIQFKIPFDPAAEWRPGRVIGRAANTPKIVMYVNNGTLPVIIKALDHELAKLGGGAGFGHLPGPSFTRRYGRSDLIFYKHEYFSAGGRDERTVFAERAAEDCRRLAIVDPAVINEKKTIALRSGGYVGENFYRLLTDRDPLEPF